MEIKDIIAAIEAFAAPELREEWDNGGLIVGEGIWECKGVLCTLDVTAETVSEAGAKGCNLIVAHHPIVFKGVKKISERTYVGAVLIKAIKADIAIYAAHTNLDNVLLGVSGHMGKKLGLVNLEVLVPKQKVLRRLITFAPHDKAEEVRQAVFAGGAGHIGKYSECSFNSIGTGTFKAGEGADPYVGEVGKQHREEETKIEIVFPAYLEKQVVAALVKAHPYEEVAYDIFTMENIHLGIGAGVIGELDTAVSAADFLGNLKNTFNLRVIRHTSLGDKAIKKVAVCGGAGASFIGAALSAGADLYITGDVKYHEFFDATDKMIIADIGHFESEQFVPDLLHDLIVEKFPTFAVLKTSVNTNPVHYFL